MTVAELAPQWRATREHRLRRQTSRTRLDSVIATHVLPEFGQRAVADITHAEVQRWVNELAARRSAAATRKAFFALRGILALAVRDRRIARSPADDVEIPPERAPEQRFLTVAEVERLADNIDPRFRALVALGAFGGLRLGELSALRRRDVDLLHGAVTVERTLVDVAGRPLEFNPPKTEAGRAPYRCRHRRCPRLRSIWPSSLRRGLTPSCSRTRPTARRCAEAGSGRGSGSPRSARPDSRG